MTDPADPTPEEIASMCQAIQQEWSPEERERRRFGRHGDGKDARNPEPYTIPVARSHADGEPVRDQFATM